MIKRWGNSNGYKDVLAISMPLVASMGSLTLMQFTDRMFLGKYSVEAISASVPAGIASFTAISFFMGVGSYTNAFVSQYTGAGEKHRVGASLWQGIYFSLISGVLLALLYFISDPLFDLIGHPESIKVLEKDYFKILILGSGLSVLSSTMATFYTGRGKTWTTMLVNMFGASVNIPLDYCLINGIGPFPELGIVGAAIATVTSSGVMVFIFGILILGPRNRSVFGTWSGKAFDRDLFLRLMRYGLPSGFQFFLEISGFTFFIQMVGRLGPLELAASNIVLAIESLAFLPMVGFHIGTATLIGQAIGRKRPGEGVYATTSSLHITLLYMLFIAILFVLVPDPLLNLFKAGDYTMAQYNEIRSLGKVLLRFVLIFCFFDALNLIFSGAIKGAGDTRFIMWTVGALSLCVMIIPAYIAVEVFGGRIYTLWTIATLYACTLGMAFMLRYRQGKWKEMKVIEEFAGISERNKGRPVGSTAVNI